MAGEPANQTEQPVVAAKSEVGTPVARARPVTAGRDAAGARAIQPSTVDPGHERPTPDFTLNVRYNRHKDVSTKSASHKARNRPRIANVRRVSPRGSTKALLLDNEERFLVPRFACVTEGDTLEVRGKNRIGLHVQCKNGLTQIFPAYKRRDRVGLGARSLPIIVKEITEPEELDGYLSLAAFHYRSEQLAGRRAVLAVLSQDTLGPRVLGYIELSTSLFMNKARKSILDAPFQDAVGFATWIRWDMSAAKRFTNLSVRIARCVVHPEYRGLGLGRILCDHALKFTRSHWQAGRVKPYFLEITADMLKFVPFVEAAGMSYIGDTQGNLDRVAKDMEYLVANFDRVKDREILKRGGGGIVAVQRKYVQKAVKILSSKSLSPVDLANRLGVLANALTPEEYFAFHGILRLPKPTYMKGLTRTAATFLRRRIRAVGVSAPPPIQLQEVRSISSSIRLVSLGVAMSSTVQLNSKTMQVQEAFGIRPDHLRSTVFSNLQLDIPPGSIVLIYGPSGSCKTTLLKVLSGQAAGIPGIEISGSLEMPPDAVVGTFEDLPTDRPLVDVLGGDDVSRSLYCLNVAGLSEAQLYLRRFDELSNGQRYRAMLAKLIDSGANVWIADEFLSTLDAITASVVAKNIREHAKRSGVTLIAGAPHYEHFSWPRFALTSFSTCMRRGSTVF